MKNKCNFFLAAILIATMPIACTSPQGEIGPQGTKGDPGAQGPKGDAGTANVIQIDFPSRIVAVESFYPLPTNISSTLVENGAFFIYVTVGGHIYSLPGRIDNSNTFSTVFLNFPNKKEFYVLRTVGNTIITFSKTRIIIIPASDIRSGRKVGVDFNDYNAVKKYYNLKN